MKKSRLFRASVLLLVISLMLSLANTTFSWFSRPVSLTGKNLKLTDSYDTSIDEDTITFNTYESLDGGDTYGITPINSFTNNIGIAAGERKCYRTDIYNAGTDPQSVSLYLQSLEKGNNCDGITIGVNGPSKSYKKLSYSGGESKVKSDIYLQNVYVMTHAEESFLDDQIEKIEYWNYNGCSGSVNWHDKNGLRYCLTGYTDYVRPVNTEHWGDEDQEFLIHRVTIDSKATNMKLKRHDAWVDTEIQIYQDNDYTTNYIVNNALFVYEYGGEYFVGGKHLGLHARLYTFYEKASMIVGKTLDLAASWDGDAVEYSSSDTKVATVNKTTGKVTALKAGTTTITVKVYGPYGSDDYISATCNLTVNPAASNSFYDVPIATNMLIEGTSSNARGVSESGVISVYWYIKNDSENSGMTYTIPEIYVTL